ncbi:HNH endonuclease [bacterium]|jgi:hypothetical protein|nr:HNH endonuclease [bacterium]
MKICIYCKTVDQEKFKGVEHVMPQSFGTFGSETPTLNCVCDECNNYFGRELDQALARDTLEGITRYKKGIFSKEQRFPKNVKFELEETEENGEYGGTMLGGYDPLTGKPIGVIPQFWIKNIKKNKWEKYRINQIRELEISDEIYGSVGPGKREMRIIGSSKNEYDDVLSELKKYKIPYREKEMLSPPPFIEKADPTGKAELRINIIGNINRKIKRALVKILFNFSTYILGEQETLKSAWDKARNFVRNDEDTLSGRFSQEPFWDGQETKHFRFESNSYNIRIENKNGNVIGIIQLYNLFTYEFFLAENYFIPPEKETAYRLTPGKKPCKGIKMKIS